MAYKFKIMTQEQAEEIALTWHYENEYSFYDFEANQEDLEEFINEDKRGNAIFAVLEKMSW